MGVGTYVPDPVTSQSSLLLGGDIGSEVGNAG